MANRRSIGVSFGLFYCLFFSPVLFAGITADEYEKLVTGLIPLSRQIADKYAGISEFDLFKVQLSKAQAALSKASADAVTLNELSPFVGSYDGLVAPDGTVKLKETLTQLLICEQLQAQRNSLQRDLDKYSSIAQEFARADQKSFESYDIARVQLDPDAPKIETGDGVYVTYGNFVQDLVNLIESIAQIFGNKSEKKKIEEQVRRFQSEGAQSSDYQAYAKAHCRELMTTFASTMRLYDHEAESLKTVLASLDSKLLDERLELLRENVNTAAFEALAAFEEDVRKSVRNVTAKDEADEIIKKNIQISLRIRRNLNALAEAEVGTADGIIEDLLSDVALAAIEDLKDTKELAPVVEAAIRRRGTVDPYELPTAQLSALFHERTPQTAMLLHPSLEGCIYGGGFAFETFCDFLHGHNQAPLPNGSGIQTTGQGGYCQVAAIAPTKLSGGVSYSLCDDSIGAAGPAIDAWGSARQWIATLDHLPGRYSAERGYRYGKEFETHLQAVKENYAQLSSVYSQLLSDHASYETLTITPSITSSIAVNSQISNTLTAEVSPKLASPANLTLNPIGEIQKSPTSSRTVQKFLSQFSSANAQRWFATFDKSAVLSDKIVQITGTGTLLLLCLAAPPVACLEAGASGTDLLADITLDFLSHAVSEMVNTDHTLTKAEGDDILTLIKAGKITKSLASGALGNLANKVLALADVVTIQMKDPKATMVINLPKDTADKANKLIVVIKKLP